MTCRTGKLPYATPQAARAVIAQQGKRHAAAKRHALPWAKGRMTAYRCQFCKAWHIGHEVNKPKEARA